MINATTPELITELVKRLEAEAPEGGEFVIPVAQSPLCECGHCDELAGLPSDDEALAFVAAMAMGGTGEFTPVQDHELDSGDEQIDFVALARDKVLDQHRKNINARLQALLNGNDPVLTWAGESVVAELLEDNATGRTDGGDGEAIIRLSGKAKAIHGIVLGVLYPAVKYGTGGTATKFWNGRKAKVSVTDRSSDPVGPSINFFVQGDKAELERLAFHLRHSLLNNTAQ